MEVWYILVNADYSPIGEPYSVDVGPKDNIIHLMKDIKEGVYKEELTHVKVTEMEVWRCRTLTLHGADLSEIDDLVRSSINGDSNYEQLGGWIRMMELQLQEYEPLVVRVSVKAKRKREDDYYEGAKSSKLARIEPSKANDASVYEALQESQQERILDDCPLPDTDLPPLPLLYDGFGEFHDTVENPDANLLETDLMNEVDQLADAMCKLGYEKGKWLNAQVHLGRIFSRAIREFSAFSYDVGNGSTTDGYLSASHGGPLLVIEYKRQIDAAELQLASYFLRLALKPAEHIFRQWRQPALGLIIRGTYISFHGLVMVDKQVRILPLTPAFPCNDSELHNRMRLYAAFGATRRLLARIEQDAAGLVSLPSPTPEIPGPSRRYPNVSSLQRVSSNSTGERLEFQITERLMTGLQGNHLLYLASTTDPNPQEILLKFSRQYGRELHQFCTSINHAPKLLAFERLPGGWFGIAMEYLPSAKRILESRDLLNHGKKWLEEIDDIVARFHAKGYVHGDLRPPNFIVSGETLWLIDFDWGGKEMEATFPEARLHPIVRDSRLEKHPTKKLDKRVVEYTKGEIRNRLGE